MKSFNNLLSCEFYKINRKKTLLKVGIAVVVIILLVMIAGLAMDYLINQAGVQEVSSDYERQIALLEMQLAEIQAREDSSVLYKLIIVNEEYAVRAQITYYKYMLENNVPAGAVTPYSLGDITALISSNYYSFASVCATTVMTLLIVFIIVMASKNTVGEFNNGTMKMQLIRPVDRNKFFTAKWLSVYVVSEGILLFSMIISFLVGLIAFGGSSPDVLIIANATGALRVHPIAALIINFLLKSVQLFALLQLTMFVNLLCKRNALAITINILITLVDLGVLAETIAAIPYVGFVGFFMNVNWESVLSTASPTLRGLTLWSMIPVTLAWIAFFTAMNYRNFARKEI